MLSLQLGSRAWKSALKNAIHARYLNFVSTRICTSVMQEGKSQYGAEDQGSEENRHSKYIPVVQISVCHIYIFYLEDIMLW